MGARVPSWTRLAATAAALLTILPADVAKAADAPADARADIERSDLPARHSQVVVALVAHECKAVSPAADPEFAGQSEPAAVPKKPSCVEAGSCLTMQIASEIAGRITVFGRSADGEMTQLYPNKYNGGLFRQAPTRVSARQAVAIPGPSDDFELKIVASPEPKTGARAGRSEIIAVVAPEAATLERAAMRLEGRRFIDSDESAGAGIQVRAVPLLVTSEGCR